jgi:hypothetical protein
MDKFLAFLKGAALSKTMWACLGLVLAALAQPVQDWISTHPGLFSTLLGASFGALRVFTTQSLPDKGNPPGQGMTP